MDRAAADASKTSGGVGVFGGTFDPIHLGHLIVADEVCATLGLQRVLFVPAQVSPLKTADAAWFSTAERVAMVRLAIADNPRFQLSCVDAQRDGPSFTYETLRLLRAQLDPQVPLHFIMGYDALELFHRWRQPQDILRLARLAVVSRPGSQPNWGALEARLPGIHAATDLIETLQVGISSSDIRRRLQTGQPVRYQLPPAVYAAIAEQPRAWGDTRS